MFCIVTFILTSCTVPLISITIPTAVTIEAGDDKTLTPVFYPTNTTNQALTWTSADETVATVSNGVITAVKPGKAIITVTGHNGKTDTCAVTVINKPVKTITFAEGTLTSYTTGDTAALSVVYAPANATVQKCTWLSSNTKVAIVDVNGNFTAVGEGAAIITATSADGKGAKGMLNVTVTSTVKKIVLSNTYITLTYGGTATLKATVYPTDIKNPAIEWYLGDAAGEVITVEGVTVVNGRITAKPTTAAKSFYVYAKYGGKTARCYVKVAVPATKLLITGYNGSIDMTVTPPEVPLSVSATPANADPIGTVTWTSSNALVAEVDSDGLVTPVGAGTAVITAKAGRLTATQTIVVTNSSVNLKTLKITAMTESKLYWNSSIEALKKSYQLALTGTDNTNAVLNSVSADEVIWTSSNKAIATVDSTGKVTAVGAGAVTITAQSKGNARVKAVLRITVATAVTDFTFAKNSYKIRAGSYFVLRPTAILPANSTSKRIIWTSSNNDVATVSATGVVKAVAANDTPVTITATSEDGDANYEITITVVDPVPVTDITLSNTKLTLQAGAVYTLKATVAPDNATNKTITWASSDTDVATVTTAGRVTLSKTASGTVNITATDSTGTVTAQCTITVTGTAATGIKLNKTTVDLVGINTTDSSLIASVLPVTADQTLVWTSADETIATVADGVITAKGYGKTIVKISNNDGRFKRTCTVNVYPIAKTTVFSAVAPRVNLETYTGAYQTLRIKDRTGTEYDNTLFTWTVNNSLVNVNSSGEVSVANGVTGGISTVTAVLTGDPAKRKVAFAVTIMKIDQTAKFIFEEMPSSDSIDEKSSIYKEFAVNSSFTVNATAYNAKGDVISSAAAPAWRSADTRIATVKSNTDGTCTITILKPGIVRIYAAAKDTNKYSNYFVLNIYGFTPISSGAINPLNLCYPATTNTSPLKLNPVYSTKIDSYSIISVYDGKQYVSKEMFTIDTSTIKLNELYSDIDNVKAGTYKVTAKVNISDISSPGNIEKCTGVSSTTVNVTFNVTVVKKPPTATATVEKLDLFDTTKQALITFKATDTIDEDCTLTLKDSTRPGFASNFRVVLDNGKFYIARNTANAYISSATTGIIEVKYPDGRFREGYGTINVKVTVPTVTATPKAQTFTVQSVTLGSAKGFIMEFDTIENYNNLGYTVTLDNSTAAYTTANAPFSSIQASNNKLSLTLKSDYEFAVNKTYTAKVKIENTNWSGLIILSLPVKIIADPLSMKAVLLSTSATINTSDVSQKFTVGYDYNVNQIVYGSAYSVDVAVTESLDWLSYSVDTANKTIAFETSGTPARGTYNLPVTFTLTSDGLTPYVYNTSFRLTVSPSATDLVISRPTGTIDVLNRGDSVDPTRGLIYTCTLRNSLFDSYELKVENLDTAFSSYVNGNIIRVTPNTDGNISLTPYTFDVVVYVSSQEVLRKTITFTPVQPALRVTTTSNSLVLHKSLTGSETVTLDYKANISYASIDSFELSESDKAMFDITYDTTANQIYIKLKDPTITAGTYRLTITVSPVGAVNPVTTIVNVTVVE